MKSLETERLFFREFVSSDAQGMFELDSNPEVHRYLGNKPVQSIEECRAVITNIRDQYKKNGIGRWAAILKETGEFIGWAGLKVECNVNGRDRFHDLGYRFIQKHWGKGYATEAAIGFVKYGFDDMRLEIINAYADAANTASRKVLEKAGLVFIETFGDAGDEEAWYEIKNPAKS